MTSGCVGRWETCDGQDNQSEPGIHRTLAPLAGRAAGPEPERDLQEDEGRVVDAARAAADERDLQVEDPGGMR